MMTEDALKRLGWTVECMSPLEIRHVDGSFASGVCAEVMLAALEKGSILSSSQKRAVIDYVLIEPGKAFFEDNPEFWEGIKEEDVDEVYPAMRDAVDEFVRELREQALNSI